MPDLISPSGTARRGRRRGAWLLPEDGEFDALAVRLVADGARRVTLTEREALAAARLMIERGADVAELAANLGTSTAAAARLLGPLGYRLSAPDPNTRHRWIVPAGAAVA